MKLNQVIAIANGTKGRCQKAITEVYHKLQKMDLLTGISRTYRPKDEEGEQLPSETKRVQYTVNIALDEVVEAMSELFDIVAMQDVANTMAAADIKVEGKVILELVPVTHLLFLEKQLVDIQTLIDKLPTLDTAEEWEFSEEANCYASSRYETTKTKKIPRNHIKAEATKEHPAQVDVYMEDVVVGYWTTMKFHGGIPEQQRSNLLKRVRLLSDAVKVAREEANGMEIEKVSFAKVIFGYLFGRSAITNFDGQK